jgi:hypothetical protein
VLNFILILFVFETPFLCDFLKKFLLFGGVEYRQLKGIISFVFCSF